MKIISVRELRSQTAKLWNDLAKEQEIVIMSNGKPVGLLTATDEDTLEESLESIRRARAMQGLMKAQLESVKLGFDKLTLDEINEEIDAYRQDQAK